MINIPACRGSGTVLCFYLSFENTTECFKICFAIKIVFTDISYLPFHDSILYLLSLTMYFFLSSNYYLSFIIQTDIQPDEKNRPYWQERSTESKILHIGINAVSML